jgi:hypothetical protein
MDKLMRSAGGLATLTLLSSLVLFLPRFARAAIVLVKQDAPGSTHDGTSWGTAFTTIPDAIAASNSGDEILVAAGAITLRPGIQVYGGIAGSETQRNQRSVSTNRTILDGGQASSAVSLTVSGSAAILDGFSGRNSTYASVYCSNALLNVA